MLSSNRKRVGHSNHHKNINWFTKQAYWLILTITIADNARLLQCVFATLCCRLFLFHMLLRILTLNMLPYLANFNDTKKYRQMWKHNEINCNCNYILFTKLPWPGDSERTFRSSSQAATCPPVYHTRRRLHTVPLIAERQAGKLWIPIFIVFGLTRPGIEPESTVSVADALSTRPLIG